MSSLKKISRPIGHPLTKPPDDLWLFHPLETHDFRRSHEIALRLEKKLLLIFLSLKVYPDDGIAVGVQAQSSRFRP
jgi:hypothetical protein